MKKSLFMILVLALALTGATAVAVADEADNQAATTNTGSTATVASTTMAPEGSAGGGSQSDWRFLVTPIAVWGMNIEGPITIKGRTANVDVSFSDLTDNMDSAGGFGFEVGRGNWSGFVSASILNLEDEATVEIPSGPVFSADLTFEFTTVEAGFAYRLPFTAGTKAPIVELLTGVRYTRLEAGIEATSGSSFDESRDISWTDPILGMKMALPLIKGFNAVVRTDVGGFGLSSNQTELQWNFVAGIGYNFKFDGWGIAVFGGYKINQFDYENHEDPTLFAMNQRMQGPIVSASAYF